MPELGVVRRCVIAERGQTAETISGGRSGKKIRDKIVRCGSARGVQLGRALPG